MKVKILHGGAGRPMFESAVAWAPVSTDDGEGDWVQVGGDEVFSIGDSYRDTHGELPPWHTELPG